LIDSVFAEHKNELKAKALSNKALSFGENQPSMQSAYKAIIGYTLFSICSVLLVITLNFAQHEYNNTSHPISGLKMFIFAVTILILGCLGSSFGHLLLGQNFKETIYMKHLHYHAPYVPYAQLLICFVSISLIFKCDSFVLYLFLTHLVLFLVGLFGFFKCFDITNAKEANSNSEQNFNVAFSQSKPGPIDPEVNIFTINA
jgi:hypothetical protein